jgi:ubiquinone/menaquinone biosynthesis C-methylase UbiE
MTERYTHGHHESVLRSHRWRTAENSAAFLLSSLEPGTRLLDVGCGPGTVTADLARRVPDGSVLGVDRSADVVERARQEFASPGPGNLGFAVADAYALGFADGSFDVVFSHQMLQHLARPADAVAEMRRVLRPGGLLAVRDADYGAFAWWPADPMLDRWMALYHDVTRRNGAEADGGRHLKAWVRAGGFAELRVSSSTWTMESPEECRWWGGLWADRVLASDFAQQALEYGLATRPELDAIAEAFQRWAVDPDAVFVVPHVEVLARR